MQSHIALEGGSGWVVWQDNATDGDGFGISARRLGSSLSGEFGVFRVNQLGVGDQENPQVAILSSGATVFVWQGGPTGMQDIYLRIASESGAFVTGDVLVNLYTDQHQAYPSVAALSGGNFVVVWSSYGQDGSFQGVYGRLFDASGAPLTAEFQVNETVQLNQRDPQVAALADGSFIVVWASEAPRGGVAPLDSVSHVVDIVGRIQAALRASEPIVRRNRDLIRLHDNLSGAECCDDFVAVEPNHSALLECYREWGFKTLQQEVEKNLGPQQDVLL